MRMTLSFREIFLKDVWLKLLALVLAVVTWYYIDAELYQQMTPSMPAAFDSPAASSE